MSLKEFKNHLKNIFAPSQSVKSELYLAVENNDTQKVKELLKTISTQNLNIVYFPPDPTEGTREVSYEVPRTAFVQACAKANEEIINEFLNRPDLNLNYHNYNGESALLIAAKFSPLRVVSTLSEKEGINLHQLNRNNDNVLMILAQRRGYDDAEELIQLTQNLINKGVNYHQQQFYDGHNNVFELAVKNGKESLVNFFLSTDIHKQNNKENIIINAIKIDSYTEGHITKMLLEKNFDCSKVEKLISKIKPTEVGEHFNKIKEMVLKHIEVLNEHHHLTDIFQNNTSLSLKDKIKNLRSNNIVEENKKNETKMKL
jgi:hypothetical protein